MNNEGCFPPSSSSQQLIPAAPLGLHAPTAASARFTCCSPSQPPPPALAPAPHLHSVAHVVQHAVVDGLADVAHRPLGVGGSDDLVRAGGVFVGRQDPDFPPGHLLFVDVHRLRARGDSAGW